MGSYIKSNKSKYPIAGGAKISSRDLVSLNATGYAVPAPAPAAGVTGTVMGSSIGDFDNTAGADGDLYVIVEHSLGETAFLFAPGALTPADAGKDVYVGATPQTISTTSANAVKAGKIQGVEDDGRVRVILPF